MKSTIILKNYATKIFSSGVSLLLGFVVTPFLLKYLGKDDFALFRISNEWLSTFSIFENALSIAILAIFAKSTDEHRDQNTWYSFKSYFKYAFIFMFFSMAFIPFLPKLYTIPVDKVNIVRIGFFIGSLNFLLLPFATFRCWLEFKEKSYLLSSARVFQNLLTAVLSMLLAYISFGIIGQFSSVLIGNIFFSLISFYLFQKFKSNFNFSKISRMEMRDVNMNIHKLNFDGLIISFCGRISFLTDTVLLGFYFHPTKILPYVLSQRLILMIQENLQSIGNASWASLLDYYRRGEQERFEKNLISISRVSNFIAVIFLTPLLVLNKDFIHLWVGEEYYYGLSLTIIASLNAYLRSNFSMWGWCLSGNGNIKAQVKIETINAAINISTSILLTATIGFLGPALGTLFGCMTVYSLLFPLALKNNLNLNLGKLYNALYAPLLWATPLFAIFYFFKDYMIITSWIKFGFFYAILASFSLITIYLLGLNDDEKKYLQNIVKSKFKKS